MKLRTWRWWKLKIVRRYYWYRSDPIWYPFEALWGVLFEIDDPEVRRVVAEVYILRPGRCALGLQDPESWD